MNTLIIYDNAGNIFSQITGNYIVPSGGVQYLETIIPDGKLASGVDITVTPHQIIFVDIPPSETEKLRADMDYIAIMTGVTI